MKFVAVSDPHIVPPGALSRGLDTAERLRLALEELAQNHGDAAFCVMCGDLCDHGEPAAYARLKAMIEAFPIPTVLMIGNHDDRASFQTAFPDAPRDPDGFVQQHLDTDEGRFIFCDTFEPDHVDGRMCRARLDWLDRTVAGAEGRPAYVFFHHPPYRTGTREDGIRLTDHAAVGEVLQRHDNVRHIFAGHTHRIASGVWCGIPFATFGATHYNGGLALKGAGRRKARYVTPAYSAVVLVDHEQVVVHGNDFLQSNPEVDPAQFDDAKIDALIAAGGRISAVAG